MTQTDPLIRPKRPESAFREGEHWEVDATTGCWNWTRFKDARGYGGCSRGKAHRVVWVQSGRELPDGHDLHHRCQNPSCVNPAHLEPVTRSEHLRAHRQFESDLSWDDVREIRARAHAGETINALADEYGMSLGTMSPLLAGRTWVDPEYTPPAWKRECPQCGEAFTARRSSQRFCSPEHKARWTSLRTYRRRVGKDLDAPVRTYTRRAA